MKYILLVAVVVCFASCKKSYQCVCRYNSLAGGGIQSSTTIKAYSKSIAEVQCYDSGSGYSCGIE